MKSFGSTLERRLFHGGLPPALLADEKKPAFFREWMDSFFARDIQRLFGFRDINRFTAFLEYVFRQSGGQFDVSKAASELGIARATVDSHLRAIHPQGLNYLVCSGAMPDHVRSSKGFEIRVVNPMDIPA